MAVADILNSSERPLISVIIPSFNCVGVIRDTLNSAIRASEDDVEILMVDGGSTDGTVEVVSDDYKERVKLIVEPDNGIYDAMNKGIRLSRGQFLYFLGAGDILLPNSLRTIAEYLKSDYGAVYGDVLLKESNAIYDGDFTKVKFLNQNVCHQAIFYNRFVFDKVGYYNLRYSLLADYALNLILFGKKGVRCKYVPITVATYEGGGASQRSVDEEFLHDRPAIIKENFGLVYWIAYYLRKTLSSLRRPF